nr:hypothetical protein CFP56_76799 [Quercus suber]
MEEALHGKCLEEEREWCTVHSETSPKRLSMPSAPHVQQYWKQFMDHICDNGSIASSILPSRPPSLFPLAAVELGLAQLLVHSIMRLAHPPPKLLSIADSRFIPALHPRLKVVCTDPAWVHLPEKSQELFRLDLLRQGRSFRPRNTSDNCDHGQRPESACVSYATDLRLSIRTKDHAFRQRLGRRGVLLVLRLCELLRRRVKGLGRHAGSSFDDTKEMLEDRRLQLSDRHDGLHIWAWRLTDKCDITQRSWRRPCFRKQ